MNFRRGRGKEELEINLIPLIDVLLVIIIFLMLTTTYSKFSGLEINLPTSETPPGKELPAEIDVAVNARGEVSINRVAVGSSDVAVISEALRRAAPTGGPVPVVVISADAKATHQSVIDIMQAAQRAGLASISFATQASPSAK